MRIDRAGFLSAVAAIGAVYALPSGTGTAEARSAAPVDDTLDTTSGSCRAKPVTRPSTCDDAHGAPGDCRKVDCRRLPFICEHCEEYKKLLKPKIAERAVACVVAQSGGQLGDGCRTYQCGDEALQGACLDLAADPACWVVSKACNASMDECRGLLSGMNDAGRQKMLACAAGGCQFGLWSCVEGL